MCKWRRYFPLRRRPDRHVPSHFQGVGREGFEPSTYGLKGRDTNASYHGAPENTPLGETRSREIAPEEMCDAHSMSNGAPVRTASEALSLAIKLAVDEGDLDRAAALIEVAKKTRAAPVVILPRVVPIRRERP